MAPKWGKSTDCDQNVISSEGGQNASTCQIWDHSFLVFPRNCPEFANLPCFTKSQCRQCNQSSRWSVGRFKNTYKLLNLRALEFSHVNKTYIFHCMGKIICVEFHKHILPMHWKIWSAAEVPVKFQSDRAILNTNLAASRLYEMLRKDVFSDIETGPWRLRKHQRKHTVASKAMIMQRCNRVRFWSCVKRPFQLIHLRWETYSQRMTTAMIKSHHILLWVSDYALDYFDQNEGNTDNW